MSPSCWVLTHTQPESQEENAESLHSLQQPYLTEYKVQYLRNDQSLTVPTCMLLHACGRRAVLSLVLSQATVHVGVYSTTACAGSTVLTLSSLLAGAPSHYDRRAVLCSGTLDLFQQPLNDQQPPFRSIHYTGEHSSRPQ